MNLIYTMENLCRICLLFLCIKCNTATATATAQDVTELIKEADDIIGRIDHVFPVCSWPLPLYAPDTTRQMKHVKKKQVLAELRRLKNWHDQKQGCFMYLDNGVLLGLYRDGVVLDDGDVDIRFGCIDDGHPPYRYPISLEDVRRWGDPWTDWGHHPRAPTHADITRIHRRLCVDPSTDFFVHDYPLVVEELKTAHGPLWFVRLPEWKGEYYHLFYERATAKEKKWTKTIARLRNIDTNRDHSISTSEINAFVVADGILWERYKTQISARDRCRAARMATWLIRFDSNPYQIVAVLGEGIDDLRFTECD